MIKNRMLKFKNFTIFWILVIRKYTRVWFIYFKDFSWIGCMLKQPMDSPWKATITWWRLFRKYYRNQINFNSNTFYKVKQKIKKLGLEHKKINACMKNCILYRKQYKHLTECPTCHVICNNSYFWSCWFSILKVRKGNLMSIDEFKLLWIDGVETYDAFSKLREPCRVPSRSNGSTTP